MTNFKKYKHDDVINKYIKLYPELIFNKTKLSRKIIEGEGYTCKDDYFRRFIRGYINRYEITIDPGTIPSAEAPALKKIVIDAIEKRKQQEEEQQEQPEPAEIKLNQTYDKSQDKQKYEIYNDSYTWESKRGPFSIPIKDADQLFYEYSKRGLDMSSTQLRLKHGIPLNQWFSLKHVLSMYKDSHIMSPHTMEITPDNEMREMIAERMRAKESDRERIIVEEHDKATIQEYTKVINQVKSKELAVERLLDDVVNSLEIPEMKLPQVTNLPLDAQDHVMICLGDLHIGGEAKNLLATPDYNYDILMERLSEVATEINAIAAKTVSIMFLGDLIESLSAMNHPSTHTHVQAGFYGARVFEAAVEAIIAFLNQINNLISVHSVSGNHDRADHDKAVEPYGNVATMIMYTLGKVYGDKLPISHNELLTQTSINDLHYIGIHGDYPVFKRKDNGLAGYIQYGDTSKFTFIITAHLHERETLTDHSKFRWIRIPAIFSGNNYSERMGFHALPGFTAIYNNNRTGKPTVIDYTL